MEDEKRSADIDRRLSLIDVSQAVDCLVESAPATSLPLGSAENGDPICTYREFEGKGYQIEPDRAKVTEQMDLLPMAAELPATNPTKKPVKCNLRRSLAWDSAFFTSEGVLDPDELALVTNTFKKIELPSLPGIEEEMRRSADSNTTIGSGSSDLESLDMELFEHLRNSVRHCGDDSDKASDASSCSSKAGSMKLDIYGCTKQKVGSISHNQIQPLHTSSTRGNSSKQEAEKTLKGGATHSNAIKGPSKVGDQKPSLRPPKILLRSYAQSSRAKQNSLHGLEPSKAKISSRTTDSHQNMEISTKSSSIHSSKTCVPALPRATSTKPGSASSNSMGKIPFRPINSKMAHRSSDHSSSGCTTKTPIPSLTKKHGHINAKVSVPSLSVSTLSSVSPASSSSDSSSPTQRLNSVKEKFGNGYSSSYSSKNTVETVTHQVSHLQSPRDGSGTETAQSDKEVPLVDARHTCQPAKESVRRGVNGASASQLIKPSGLRLPSPKIGFFDAEKFIPRGSNGSLQSPFTQPDDLPRSYPRVGSVSGGGKPRSSNKHQLVRCVAETGDGKVYTSEANLASPLHFKGPENVAMPTTFESGSNMKESHVSDTIECERGSELGVPLEGSDTTQCQGDSALGCAGLQVDQVDIIDGKCTTTEGNFTLEGMSYHNSDWGQLSSSTHLTALPADGAKLGTCSQGIFSPVSPSDKSCSRTPLSVNTSLNRSGSFGYKTNDVMEKPTRAIHSVLSDQGKKQLPSSGLVQ